MNCWVMVGTSGRANGLAAEDYVGHYLYEPPNAANFKIGQWILWQDQPTQTQISLVCVDIPVASKENEVADEGE